MFSPLFVPSITALPSARRKQDDEVRTVQVKEQEHNVLVLKRVQCCGPAPPAGSADSDWRYVVVSGTPEKILEHLLNDLHLEEVQDKETETLLDDFLLTYTVFMTTDDLCQALLRQYPSLTSGCCVGFLSDRCLALGINCLS